MDKDLQELLEGALFDEDGNGLATILDHGSWGPLLPVATAAMQGMLAHSGYRGDAGKLAKDAIEIADALFTEMVRLRNVEHEAEAKAARRLATLTAPPFS
jgi:hypothetical protein